MSTLSSVSKTFGEGEKLTRSRRRLSVRSVRSGRSLASSLGGKAGQEFYDAQDDGIPSVTGGSVSGTAFANGVKPVKVAFLVGPFRSFFLLHSSRVDEFRFSHSASKSPITRRFRLPTTTVQIRVSKSLLYVLVARSFRSTTRLKERL